MSEQNQQAENQEQEVPEVNEAQVEEAQAAQDDAPEVGDVDVTALQAEVAELKDQLLRNHAEMQNVRRRAEQDVEKAHKFGNEKFAKEMLTVVDNLERALQSLPEEQDEHFIAMREGVEMTLNSTLATFAKFSIEPVNPENEPFDPQLHQAMSMVDNPELPANTVMAVMQKGYTLHGRLLRPAMVMVSKGGPTPNSIDETA
ncbi:nucleotide exchange factor GrpE [Salinibius halmophilus]|uniref:nucleotide exchange factor GrpE n=1 Tax=Salinibius halmophilus TaxID=1853216 RepID=UPI000E664896|nr:nucleotide exchange factor GrpE [Salinibius halmophilus]